MKTLNNRQQLEKPVNLHFQWSKATILNGTLPTATSKQNDDSTAETIIIVVVVVTYLYLTISGNTSTSPSWPSPPPQIVTLVYRNTTTTTTTTVSWNPKETPNAKPWKPNQQKESKESPSRGSRSSAPWRRRTTPWVVDPTRSPRPWGAIPLGTCSGGRRGGRRRRRCRRAWRSASPGGRTRTRLLRPWAWLLLPWSRYDGSWSTKKRWLCKAEEGRKAFSLDVTLLFRRKCQQALPALHSGLL